LAPLVFTPGVGHATIVIDQSVSGFLTGPDTNDGFAVFDDGGSAPGDYQDVAQSFTVGVTGKLTEIDLRLFRTDNILGSAIEFDLTALSSGLPNLNHVLRTETIPLSNIPISPFVFIPGTHTGETTNVETMQVKLSQPLQVHAGEVLAFVLSGGGPHGAPPWTLVGPATPATGLTDSYAGGREFLRYDALDWGAIDTLVPDLAFRDLAFRDLVEVPEPTSLSLVGSALILAAGRARRRRAA
jgi:hypothetical protein